MKNTSDVFKETLEELGFADHLPNQMSNSDYWLCTTTAMKNYAKQYTEPFEKIDLLGNEIKTGDVLLEFGRGGGWNREERSYSLKLWEMPQVFDGHAYYYSIDGIKHSFAWAHVGNAIKVDMDLMPDGFEYSFKHGMSDFNTKIENGTLNEVIENSDWMIHEVKKEEVERYEFMKTLKIETFDDLKNNIEELKKGGYVPHEIVSNVLSIAGVGRAHVHNGEIGIAEMYDQMHYQSIIEAM